MNLNNKKTIKQQNFDLVDHRQNQIMCSCQQKQISYNTIF